MHRYSTLAHDLIVVDRFTEGFFNICILGNICRIGKERREGTGCNMARVFSKLLSGNGDSK